MIIQRPKEKCLEIKHISGKEKNTHYFVIPLSKDVGTFWKSWKWPDNKGIEMVTLNQSSIAIMLQFWCPTINLKTNRVTFKPIINLIICQCNWKIMCILSIAFVILIEMINIIIKQLKDLTIQHSGSIFFYWNRWFYRLIEMVDRLLSSYLIYRSIKKTQNKIVVDNWPFP